MTLTDFATAQRSQITGIAMLARNHKVFFHEKFDQNPRTSAELVAASYTTANARIALYANKNFVVGGLSAVGGKASLLATDGLGGIKIIASNFAGTGRDVSITPTLIANQSQANALRLTTGSGSILFSTKFKTGAAAVDIATQKLMAGLVLTTAYDLTTDNDQVKFWYDPATSGNLKLASSVGGTDYLDDTGIAIAASTEYQLGIFIGLDLYYEAWVKAGTDPWKKVVSSQQKSMENNARTGKLTTAIRLLPRPFSVKKTTSQQQVFFLRETYFSRD